VRAFDPYMLVLMAVLIATGLLFVYGAGRQIGGRLAGYWIRQVLWIGVGLAAFVTAASVDYRRLSGLWAWLLYASGIALLVLVLVAGREINGARSWLPVLGMTLQPAEFAKPTTVLFLAWMASRRVFHFARLLDLGVFGLAVMLPALLVAKQPDWGTALVFAPAGLAVAFAAGLSWRALAAGAAIAVLGGYAAYSRLLEPRQRERIHTFLQPSADVTDAGWNARQSLLAVGSGGVWGKGFMRGDQHALGYLPRKVAPTDFIFSVIGEETGFVGAGAVVCAFLGILLCCLRTAVGAPDRFGALLCVGVAGLIVTHMFINIGMTIQIAPIVGIPLPLVSYGGSFMISMMASLGLVQSVYGARADTGGNRHMTLRKEWT
jgi:rod shape determining protein RodA